MEDREHLELPDLHITYPDFGYTSPQENREGEENYGKSGDADWICDGACTASGCLAHFFKSFRDRAAEMCGWRETGKVTGRDAGIRGKHVLRLNNEEMRMACDESFAGHSFFVVDIDFNPNLF